MPPPAPRTERDRLVRLETRYEGFEAEVRADLMELHIEMAAKLELQALERRFDDYRKFVSRLGWTIFGVVLAELASIIGLLIYKATT